MKTPRPVIKFNGGNPIALCKRCFIIMCYVTCAEKDKTIEDEGKCIVKEPNGDSTRLYTSVPVGDPVPVYCDQCEDLLNYSIN